MKTTHLYYLLFLLLCACNTKKEQTNSLFELLDSTKSGIQFSNDLVDTDAFNIMQYLYYYNGGGVAAGDLNNDGHVDLYFTGNQVDDAVYLNNGDLTFRDISQSSGINKYKGWSTGVTMLDVNQDGWLDIYVCRLGKYKIYNDHNRLFVNNQDGTFTESAEHYGLDFSGFSTQAAFFDYDNDGDLDCYLLNHSVKRPDQFVQADKIRYEVDSLAGDRLYKNANGKFEDVTQASNIYASSVGFGLSVSVADVNLDGWSDIYVGNDFHENDYLYLNNADGTFREVIGLVAGHTSNFTMGSAFADINNDQQWDILSLDMQPYDETIFKQSGGWESKQIYDFKRSYGYHDQSPKNALQLNLGIQNGLPMFSDQAGIYGLEATDWSWSPLVADFDLDEDTDIFITNGIYRRPNDMDFVNYFSEAQGDDSSDKTMIDKMPMGKVENQYFAQHDDKFISIPIGNPSVSNGACTADLDNDGDLDIVINNINEKASLLINTTNPKDYLKLSFKGIASQNLIKSGVSVQYTNEKSKKSRSVLFTENKGFQSKDEAIIILPKIEEINNVSIQWSDGSMNMLDVRKVNKELIIGDSIAELRQLSRRYIQKPKIDSLFRHTENVYNDQNKEPLLLYNFSQSGPRIATNQDGHVFITQGKGKNGSILNPSNEEIIQTIDKGSKAKLVDETDALFFDADGDRDEDLYICLGGNELSDGDLALPDILFINERGTYIRDKKMLPKITKNTSVVTAADYDNDGDIDVFIGVQSRAGDYGNPDASYLLRNENNESFQALLIDVQEMVFAAEWADMDADGRLDLIVVGHWMPITIFYNREKSFEKYEIPFSEGWWYSLAIADLDKDSKPDILAGNFGQNHRLEVSKEYPLKLYLHDFDNNDKNDPIVTYRNKGKEYPYANLDLLLKQIPAKKKKFLMHSEYAKHTIERIFSKEELANAMVKSTATLSSSVFYQDSPKDWYRKAMPLQAQLAPIWAIAAYQDGFIMAGNHFDIDPNLGRQDALAPSFLQSDGRNMTVITDESLPLTLAEIRSITVLDSILLFGVNDGQVLKKVISQRDK